MVRSSSYIATPPGATIREQLSDRGMSQKEFAARMDMSEKHISKLINGEVQLTPDVAVRLETVLGVPAKFWNNLEAIYREKLVKASQENAMEADKAVARQLPYREMAAYGWIAEASDTNEKIINLRKYFEVVDLSLLESPQVTKIACRRLAVTDRSDLVLMAWAQKARIEARNVDTAPINMKGLIKAIPEIREMTNQNPEVFCPRLKELLAENGVALVFLPHLRGSFLQGASFTDGNKIVLGMTVRGKDADKFWFSLFHELGHIILGHIGQIEGTSEADEKSADIWAGDQLIPNESFETYLDGYCFTANSIRNYAKDIGIAPGIVVGRLQAEGYIKHNTMNGLKEQYAMSV